MSQIKIRKTAVDDIEEGFRLVNRIWRIAYAHIMPKEIFDQRDAALDEKIKKAKEAGVNKDGRIDYVAVDGDRIVAIVKGTSVSGYKRYRNMDYADLTAVYIDPEYQRQGLGKKLFDKVVEFFKSQGRTRMTIGVLKENHAARKAYEKWGGRLDGYEKYFVKQGHSFPEVFYLYDLDTGA